MFKNPLFPKIQQLVCFVFLFLLGSASHAAELDCMVKPEMYIELSSAVPGVLEKVWVNKGDHVIKGQVLAQLESSVEAAKVKQAKYEAASDSEIKNRKAHLEFAVRNRARSDDLYARGSLSKAEKDKAETDVALAQTELARAIEQKKTAVLKLEVANAQLELKTIISPIEGIVIDRYAMIGESVAEKAIMKLAQVDPLRVELVAPTEYFGLIQKEMEVEVRPRAAREQILQGNRYRCRPAHRPGQRQLLGTDGLAQSRR